MSKSVTSLQIKVHECFVKPLKPRESLLTFEEDEGIDEDKSGVESDVEELNEILEEANISDED